MGRAILSGRLWTVDVNVAASTSIYTQLYGEEEQGDTLWRMRKKRL